MTTFQYVGASPQTYTVPTGVASVIIECYGAQGNVGGSTYEGGKGGYAKSVVTVTPGETLQVYVGGSPGPGGLTGGYNGGGSGGSYGFGGGGASDVRRGGTTLANRVCVGAGGGGGTYYGRELRGGAGGGSTGGVGDAYQNQPLYSGQGGTQTAGGAGSASNGLAGSAAGVAGALGLGGGSNISRSGNSDGGGGGGGYYGGGSGSYQGSDAAGSTPGSGTPGGGGSSLAQGSGATTTAGVRAGDGMVIITPLNAAPSAPLLGAPGNGTTADLAAGFTATWTAQDPDGPGDMQSAYALRRKASGAGAYEWWNATSAAFQASEVFNPGSAGSVTFPAGKWTNGTVYNWSVATRDSSSTTGPYSGDSTVTASTAPTVAVTAPTGTISTSRPTVTWTFTDPENDPQESWQVRVFTAAQYGAAGFDPGSSPAFADSGQSAGASVRSWQTPTLDNSTTYRAYVRSGQAGGLYSAWAFSTFTVSLTPPVAPTMTATDDPANGRVRLLATVTLGGSFSRSNTTVIFEYRDSATAAWSPVRRGTVGVDLNNQAAVFDYEAPPGTVRFYRARTLGDL